MASPEKAQARRLLPSRQQVLDFITSSDEPAGKREIARAFGLKGNEKIALKALLKDMADEGLLDIGPARAFHLMGGVPKVTVLRVIDVDGSAGDRRARALGSRRPSGAASCASWSAASAGRLASATASSPAPSRPVMAGSRIR